MDIFEEIRRIEARNFKIGKDKHKGGLKASVDEAEQEKPEMIAAAVAAMGWGESFPNVKVLSHIKALTQHKDYKAAKAGDVEAAFNLVKELFTIPENADTQTKAKIKRRIEKIKELKRKYPNVILVAVHAQEATGKNQIPKQLARYIGEYLGFEVNDDIVQVNAAKRTGQNKDYRMQKEHQPIFDGKVEEGKEYILIDDAVTMGGTFAALNKLIRNNGGIVVDTAAIGAAQFSSNLAINSKTLYNLLVNYRLTDILQVMQEAGLYEETKEETTETTTAAGRSEDVDAAGNSGVESGCDKVVGIRQKEDSARESERDQSFPLSNYSQIAYLTEAQAREVLKILKQTIG
jgi:hypothetical protein